MNINAAVCWRTCAFVYLFCDVSFCTPMLGYTRIDTNFILPGGCLYLPGVTIERCFARCSMMYECFFVGYDTVSGDCMLSSLDVLVTGKIPAEGWSLSRLKPPCEFVTIGAHELALCSRRMTKAYADNACASFGSWRLIEPRTLDMYWEIVNYILAMPVDEQLVYNSLWVGVEYDKRIGTWLFSDGSQLPLETTNSADVDGTKPCLRLNHNRAYKYADQRCTNEYSYICEKIK